MASNKKSHIFSGPSSPRPSIPAVTRAVHPPHRSRPASRVAAASTAPQSAGSIRTSPTVRRPAARTTSPHLSLNQSSPAGKRTNQVPSAASLQLHGQSALPAAVRDQARRLPDIPSIWPIPAHPPDLIPAPPLGATSAKRRLRGTGAPGNPRSRVSTLARGLSQPRAKTMRHG